MSRTNSKWVRPYFDGLDISGVAREVGAYGVQINAPADAALGDQVMNVSLGRGSIKCGPINAFLAPATAPTGLIETAYTGVGTRNIMIATGINAEPAVGDPAFIGQFEQAGYMTTPGTGFVTVTITTPESSYAGPHSCVNPFGFIVHPKGAETAVNTAVATLDNSASSTGGGLFSYQLLSSDGTCTLSLDDSATNANNAAFAALSGATSGSIDASSTPKSGLIAITGTIRRYVRWQIAFGTATTATFALALTRQY